MTPRPLYQIDAFTTTPLAGNPCAVVLDAAGLDDARMLAIAREMNLSETSFVLEPDGSDLRARYFTPGGEIPFAGHPTLATVAALAEAGRLDLGPEPRLVTLSLPAGTFDLQARRGPRASVETVISQLPPQFEEPLAPSEVLAAFGLSADDALPETRPQVVSTGVRQLMVPLRSHAALERATPDHGELRQLLARTGSFGPHLFCLGGFTPHGDTAARHFGVPPDLLEDPFTGSATGGMAAFLWRHGLLDRPRFVAEQGHPMGRPGTATVEVLGTRSDIAAVKVGGDAVVVLEGRLRC